MGGRQSRRSVDITTTPKKEGIPADGSVGDAAAPGDGKLERIEETDTKPTTNGIAPHTDIAEDKEKDKDEATEKEKQADVKAEETKQESAGESPAESAEATTPTDATTPASPNAVTSPDSKETKKKEKMKKKWSFRSISFSKKDKNKPARDEAPKNGDVTKEETLAEGGEEAENGSATAGSPVEEKSAVSSPSAEAEAAPASSAPSTETKEEASSPSAAATTATAASSPVDEKQEEPTPSAPTPVPVEEKKEEVVEKLEAEKKVVEVSPAGGQFVTDPVEVSVFRVQTVATTPSSIIERKTSEDIPSLPPSSPPPTPIDPSPLQQAQQAAASATLLAEALKLPAETAAGADNFVAPPTTTTTTTTAALSFTCPSERDESPPPTTPSLSQSSPLSPTSPPSLPPAESRDLTAAPQIPHVLPPDESLTEQTNPTPPKLEALPVVDTVAYVVDAPKSLLDREQNMPVEQKEQVPPAEQKEDEVQALPTFLEKSPERKTVSAEPTEKAVVEQSIRSNVVCELGSPAVERTEQEHVREKGSPIRDVEEPVVQGIVATQEVCQEEPAKEPVVEPSISICDSVLDSEEGPVPLSEEILVVAKPAVVIPEEEEKPVEAIPSHKLPVFANPKTEEKPETKMMEDLVVVPVEKESLEEDVSAKMEAIQIEPEEPKVDDKVEEKVKDKVENVQDEEPLPPPPPVPSSPVPECACEELDLEATKSIETVVPCPPEERRSQDEQKMSCSLAEPKVDQSETESFCPNPAYEAHKEDSNSLVHEEDQDDESQTTESSTNRLEPVSVRSDELPPAPRDTVTTSTDSFEYPLPPEELSCPLATTSSCSIVSETKSELLSPVPDKDDKPSPRNLTETLLLTPSRSPSPHSTVVGATNVVPDGLTTTSTINSSQTTQVHLDNHAQDQDQDESDRHREKNPSSPRSPCTVNEHDDSVLRKTPLAKSPAETENQEESSISCQLSNKNTTSSATVQETHQSTPESEAPVENNLVQDSTTEKSEEKIVVTPAAVPVPVPVETPAPPPAITEDVASVAKAVEEMEISAKAVAAATIECATTEIVADGPYENNVNE